MSGGIEEAWRETIDDKRKEEPQKYDMGKPRYSLLPWLALIELVNVREYGVKKYSEDSWRGLGTQRNVNAALRHIAAYLCGEKEDKESGEMHLAHAACDLLFAIWEDKQ